jgi:hypothetical protein
MMKKILPVLGIIAVLIAGAIGGGFGKLVGTSLVEPDRPTSQEIEVKLIEGFKKAAKQVNRNTPTMVDKDTRMDRATVGPGARVTYHHTFLNYTSKDIDPNWLRTNLRPVVKKNVCANEDMKASLQYGGIYIFSYSGNDGIKIASFEIDRNDCGFPRITP